MALRTAAFPVGGPVKAPRRAGRRRPARRQESHAGAARRGEPVACRTPRPGQPVSAQRSADTGRAGLRGLACSLAGLGCQGGAAACAPGVQSTQGNGKSKNGPRSPGVPPRPGPVRRTCHSNGSAHLFSVARCLTEALFSLIDEI